MKELSVFCFWRQHFSIDALASLFLALPKSSKADPCVLGLHWSLLLVGFVSMTLPTCPRPEPCHLAPYKGAVTLL